MSDRLIRRARSLSLKRSKMGVVLTELWSNAQYSNIGIQLALNGSTMHITILIGSDRAVNLALLLEVIRTMFFSA